MPALKSQGEAERKVPSNGGPADMSSWGDVPIKADGQVPEYPGIIRKSTPAVGQGCSMPGPCYAMARYRNVMICARVQVVLGENVVSVVPEVMPSWTAHATASV